MYMNCGHALFLKDTMESDQQVVDITSLPLGNPSPSMYWYLCNTVKKSITLMHQTHTGTEHLLARRKKVNLTLENLRCIYSGNWLNDQVNNFMNCPLNACIYMYIRYIN